MSATESATRETMSKTVAFSVASAITTILASAGVIMWAIIAQPEGDTVGKTFLTVFLMAIFAFSLIGETRVEHEAPYITPARIACLVLIIASGLYLTWNQVIPEPWQDFFAGDFLAWLGVILLLEGIVATLILLLPAMTRNMKNQLVRYTFNAGVVLVAVAALMTSLAWTTWDLPLPDDYWRIVLAICVLALVTFLLPLVISMILAPKKPRAAPRLQPPQPQQPQPHGTAAEAANLWSQVVARGVEDDEQTTSLQPPR